MKYFKKRNSKIALTLQGTEMVWGYIFLIPFLVGFFGFFLPMIIQSITFSFSNMTVDKEGYHLTKAAQNGFEHYIRALTIDPDFNTKLLDSIKDMFLHVPLVIIFSFFAATLLNQAFKGRAIARTIFFLPVIMTSGVVLGLENSDLLVQALGGSAEEANLGNDIADFLNMTRFLTTYTNLPKNIISYLSAAVNGIYDIVVASGVQILIFLAGLQSVSPSLYEASSMEGATAWENFWKITFPMISPLILVNCVYTIVDLFTNETNSMMSNIYSTIFGDIKYGFGSAMAWIYFICVSLILLVCGLIISRKVFYYDER